MKVFNEGWSCEFVKGRERGGTKQRKMRWAFGRRNKENVVRLDNMIGIRRNGVKVRSDAKDKTKHG